MKLVFEIETISGKKRIKKISYNQILVFQKYTDAYLDFSINMSLFGHNIFPPWLSNNQFLKFRNTNLKQKNYNLSYMFTLTLTPFAV